MKLIKLLIKIVIILLIFVGIVYALIKFDILSKYVFKNANNKEAQIVDITTNLKKFDIELSATKLNIYVGSKFSISSNNDNLKYEEDEDTFEISEKENLLLKITKSDYILNIELPSKDFLEELEISAGAGSVNISDLSLEDLEISLGAGVLETNNVKSISSTEIKGGTGAITLENCNFTNLDMLTGASETNISGIFNGKTDIESGLGNFTLNILDNKENYSFKFTKGTGDIIIDKEEITTSSYGEGSNLVSIKSGIGTIDINFK